MSENTNILILSALLVVILVAIGFVASYQFSVEDTSIADERESKQIKTAIVTTGLTQPESTNRVLVHDRFVGKIDEDGVVVAISNGQAVSVRNGVVLTNDMVISANEEAYSVYRVNDPEKSVSSN